MSTNVVLFNLLQLSVSAYAWWRGGPPERLVAMALIVAAAVTFVAYAPMPQRFVGVEAGVLLVDLSLLGVLVAVALQANRHWPMAVASMHLASVLVHAGKLLDLTMDGWAYAFLLKLWAYPMLLALVVGTMRHRRRLARFGVDHAWSSYR